MRNNSQQLRKSKPAREKFSQLMGRDYRIYKNIKRDKHDLFRTAEDKLSVLFMLRRELFLKRAGFRIYSMLLDVYDMFTVDTLCNLHLIIQRILEETSVLYLSSDTA